MSNKELSKELHKPIIRKFKKIKVQWPFTENAWDAVLRICKFNKGTCFLWCSNDIFSK